MKEIGGYLEFEHYHMPMLHQGMHAFNCARNCLAYLIEKRKIKKIYIPFFLCDSVYDVCKRYDIVIEKYFIDSAFLPLDIEPSAESWVYIVNYYGQLSNGILNNMKNKYGNVIIDNVQAYFQEPLIGVDTIYTCRKYFGVTDGAFLYSDVEMDETLPYDESTGRINYLTGRFEKSGTEYYNLFKESENRLAVEPIMRMSKLTMNLLHGIDYEFVKQRRTENFQYLNSQLSGVNKLKINVPDGAYMYPLYVDNGEQIRRTLVEKKIYVPVLWPNVLDECDNKTTEYNLAANIIPLPVDQRYGIEDMKYVVDILYNIMEE